MGCRHWNSRTSDIAAKIVDVVCAYHSTIFNLFVSKTCSNIFSGTVSKTVSKTVSTNVSKTVSNPLLRVGEILTTLWTT